VSAPFPHDRFDDWFDRFIEPIRNLRVIIFMFTIASAVGDFGLLWHAIGFARVALTDAPIKDALIFSLMIGIESLLLNQGIKRFFRRTRPTTSGDERFTVRTPRTSSFPSGHASSAFFSALVLTHWVNGWQIGLFYLFAVIIAFSRIGVRIHHTSDVLAGALTGTVMGAIGLIALASL